MIYSSKIDYKPFARVWRKYEDALSRIETPTVNDVFHVGEGQWTS